MSTLPPWNLDPDLLGGDYFSFTTERSTTPYAFLSFPRLPLFDVYPDNGTIYVKKGQELDRERKSSYFATLQARDSVGNVGATVLDITIEDINDQKPQFLRSPYEVFIRENTVLKYEVEVKISFKVFSQGVMT